MKVIEKATKLCIVKEEFSCPCEVYINLTDDETIREINNEHRKIDKATDVLSFPLVEFINGKPNILPGDIDPETNRVYLGDIIISVEKAKKQAENFGHSFEREIAFLAVHGMLHLLGYDHENKNDETIMFAKQEEVLNEVGLKRE